MHEKSVFVEVCEFNETRKLFFCLFFFFVYTSLYTRTMLPLKSFIFILSLSTVPKTSAQYWQSATYAPELFGNLLCLEPGHRFLSTIQHKLDHNSDYPNQPEEWICQFCGNKLMMIVQKICCGVEIRKRREAEEVKFWHEVSHQSHKLISKHETNVVGGNSNHPTKLMMDKAQQDCMDDNETKHNKRSRNKRNTQTIAWKRSIKNGGKGRSTLEETQGITDLTCGKSVAAQFLHLSYEGKTPDRSQYKHTYIQRECCGINGHTRGRNGKKIRKDSCDLEEITQSFMHEECCQEGCRVEEIYENCGAWRWDMKENWEEKIGNSNGL